MNTFLSEENIELHREYLRKKKLQYSILETSLEVLKNAKVSDVFRMKLTPRDKSDALGLLTEIKLHDIFFSSFSKTRFPRSESVERKWGSCASFLNEVYRTCMKMRYGFVCVYFDRGDVLIDSSDDFVSLFSRFEPVLAIDVCEHSYFLDYYFDKERYLLNALPHLNLNKL